MISVTFQFKTLEGARAAMLEIPESSLVGGCCAEPAPVADINKPAAPAKAVATRLRQANHPDDKSQITSAGTAGVLELVPEVEVEAPKPEPVATTSSAKPSASVDYPTLQKAVFALAGKSRDAVVAIAAGFGAKTFKELPEAKWADAHAAVTGKLAELEAA